MSILADEVIRAARDEYKKWKNSARLYACIAKVLRPLLIIATALVAADKILGTHFKALATDGWFLAVISVFAAAGTGIEAWLKPAEKWKGFLADRDVMQCLLIRAKSTDPSDMVALTGNPGANPGSPSQPREEQCVLGFKLTHYLREVDSPPVAELTFPR